jgi:hypothetical protein
MKNIFLSTLFALITTLGFSQLTYVPDDAFENYIETNSGVPFNNDNYVSTSVIQNWLYNHIIFPINVTDLTGLEAFGQLDILQFSGSNISVIDLSNYSNLVLSTFNSVGGVWVYVRDCPFLTTVIMPPNEIAFCIGDYPNTNCPYLTDIIFQNSNIIRNPDPSNLTSTNFLFWNPSLYCIDMSNILDVTIGSNLGIAYNSNLSGLKLNNGKCNKWGSVNISENPNLECIQVDNPSFCYNAQSLGAWEWTCITNPPSQFLYSTSCANCIAEVDELPTVSINISPNPTSSKITVKASLALIGEEFTIYDQLGKAVMSGVITSEETEIDLSNLTEGVYLFKAGAEMQETFKIIKQ